MSNLIFLGYDPGGKNNANGTAFLKYSASGISANLASLNSVDEALDWFDLQLDGSAPQGFGIDSFLYWETGEGGWRGADNWLKDRYPIAEKSVLSSNSAFGAMAVQGMAMAIRVRKKWAIVRLNEAHPKVLYAALSQKKYDWPSSMNQWLCSEIGLDAETPIENDHEWDALISAWAAMKGFNGEWTNNLRSLSKDAIEPAGEVSYWWSEY